MTEDDVKDLIDQIQIEVNICGIAYYQWKEIHNICSSMSPQPRTLSAHSSFWAATLASLQNTYMLGLSKLFDKSKSAFSLDTVLKHCKNNSGYFSSSALESRKLKEGWPKVKASAYAIGSFQPSPQDFDALASQLNNARTIVQGKIQPIRHKVIAHTQKGISKNSISSLYGQVNTSEIESVIDEANTIGILLWGNWVNGQDFTGAPKPFMRPSGLSSETNDLIIKASVP